VNHPGHAPPWSAAHHRGPPHTTAVRRSPPWSAARHRGPPHATVVRPPHAAGVRHALL